MRWDYETLKIRILPLKSPPPKRCLLKAMRNRRALAIACTCVAHVPPAAAGAPFAHGPSPIHALASRKGRERVVLAPQSTFARAHGPRLPRNRAPYVAPACGAEELEQHPAKGPVQSESIPYEVHATGFVGENSTGNQVTSADDADFDPKKKSFWRWVCSSTVWASDQLTSAVNKGDWVQKGPVLRPFAGAWPQSRGLVEHGPFPFSFKFWDTWFETAPISIEDP
jgi:hypothetical protein